MAVDGVPMGHVLDVTEKQILCVKHYGKIFAYCKYCFDVQNK